MLDTATLLTSEVTPKDITKNTKKDNTGDITLNHIAKHLLSEQPTFSAKSAEIVILQNTQEKCHGANTHCKPAIVRLINRPQQLCRCKVCTISNQKL